MSGGSIHLVEQGEGPLVLLLHGFPESWRSWRHQLPALAAAGYRAVAIDLRGYGDSLVPEPVEEYRMLAHVADNVAVLRALDAPTAAVVGHDWGSPIAAASALMRPDLFTALGLLGVPYAPRSPMRPTEAFAHAGGDDEFYVSYFQHPGQAEAEIEADIRGWLVGFYVALSGESGRRHVDVFTIPPGATMREKLPADAQPPSWLSPEDLDASVRSFGRTGVAGALNRYRNVDRDWEDLAAWDGLTDQATRHLHRRGARRVGDVARRRDRGTRHHAPRLRRQPHPRRLRALGPAGAPRRRQPAPPRLAGRNAGMTSAAKRCMLCLASPPLIST